MKNQKPQCWDEIKIHFGNKELKGEDCCIIGDRLLSDVLMGH